MANLLGEFVVSLSLLFCHGSFEQWSGHAGFSSSDE